MNPKQMLWTCLLGMNCLVLAGCASSPLGFGTSEDGPSLTEQKFATSKEELKNPVKLHLHYAKWQEHIGNLSESRDSYEFVLSEEPESVDAILGLARLDQLSGRTHQAEQGFQKALKLSPGNPQALEAAGQFYAAEERWGEAVQYLRQGVAAAPDDRAIRFNFAVVLAKSGDIDSALPEFVEAIGEAEAHYNIGLVLYEKGELAASEQHFAQALKIKPDLQEAQYWLSELRGDEAARSAVAAAPSDSRSEKPAPPRPAIRNSGLTAPNPRRTGRVRQAAATQPAGNGRPGADIQQLNHERAAIRPSPSGIQRPQLSPRPVITSRQESDALTQHASAAPQSSWAPRSGATQSPPPGLTPEQMEQWRNQSRSGDVR